MAFKRQEGFRFAFGEPLSANFMILTKGERHELTGKRLPCKIIDVSPRGMKIMTDVDLKNFSGKGLQLELYFYLDATEIKAVADVVWTKVYGSNFQYGLFFYNQPAVEDLIVEELKVRRRKEVMQSKSNL